MSPASFSSSDDAADVNSNEGGTIQWRILLAEAVQRFDAGNLPDSKISARRIVEQAAGLEPTEFALGLDQNATVRGVAQFDAMVNRRLTGEPLQYVVGSWGFRTLDLAIDSRVLIPRPETEELVEWALVELGRADLRGLGQLTVVDLGTGSGAIGLSILAEVANCEVWMTDRSESALEVARANLAGLGQPGVRGRIVSGSWFDALPGTLRKQISLIVSNPPYVATDDLLPPVVADWEPASALVSGPSGTEDVESVIREAPEWLMGDGALVVEMAPGQVVGMAELASEAFGQVNSMIDMAGRERAIVARYPRA